MPRPSVKQHEKTIRLGRAMLLAYEQTSPNMPKKADIGKALIAQAGDDLEQFPSEDLWRWYYLGKQNPRPLIESLARKLDELSRYSDTPWLQERVQPMQALVRDLRLGCGVPRWSGRPKGKRNKVTPDDIDAVRRWMKDRRKAGSLSASELARTLKVSRQTLYKLMKEIESGQANSGPSE
jgi:hypothetical protein